MVITCRGSKLQKEQQKRRDAARLRIQRERRAKEAAARDQARVEEQIKARKLEQRRKEEEVGYKTLLYPVVLHGGFVGFVPRL